VRELAARAALANPHDHPKDITMAYAKFGPDLLKTVAVHKAQRDRHFRFLQPDAMLAWCMLSSCVHPSVTRRYCTKTATLGSCKQRWSRGTPVFSCQRYRRNSNQVTPMGVPN